MVFVTISVNKTLK